MERFDYLTLKENVSHGNFEIPMNIYTGILSTSSYSCLHWHNEMELIYISSGNGILHLDLKDYPINSGDILLIPKGSLHYMSKKTSGTLEYTAIVFDLEMFTSSNLDFCTINFIHPLINKELMITPIIRTTDLSYNIILQYILDICHSFSCKDFAFQLSIKGAFLSLFSILFTCKYIVLDMNNLSKNNTRLDKIKAVINYINENYYHVITVSDLCNIAGYSEYHFLRFFKDQTGKTCTQFINTLRINKSLNLLVTTNLSITEITYDVGFNDVSYFIKTFKKYLDKSPTSYRKEIKSN
ncbi:AraC family transcriptional regulator [Clostridium sp.]|uniref:AraC family transcriptional regulator n=1 Tax=Clostridium sp. TaxID=1506 RepID=UPI002FC887A0